MKKSALALLVFCFFSAPVTTLLGIDKTNVADSAVLAASAAEGAEALAGLTVRQIITDGGVIMYPLVALSFVAVGLIIFYLLTLREKLIYPKAFIREAQDAAEMGDLEALRELCHENGSPAAKVIHASLEQCVEGQPIDLNAVQSAMEDEGSRQAGYLWQRIQYLLDVSAISPMVGLLGTVWGMMISFSGLESGVNLINKADALASGVSQAMYTTFGGLVIAIPSMAIYALFRGRVNTVVSSMESACNSVLRRLANTRKSSVFKP